MNQPLPVMLRVSLLLLCVLWVIGCVRQTAPPAQPYDQLVYLSGTEVKGRLGDPSEVKPQGKGATWRYNDLNLMVSLFEDRVHRVDVGAGPVTEGLAVGDDEANVQALTAKVQTGSSGFTFYVLKRETLWYRIAVKDNKVQQAVIEVPATP